MTIREKLTQHSACNEAMRWSLDMTLHEIWQQCERGDWMLWLYAISDNFDLRLLVLAAGHCANTVRELMTDQRSINAVDAAIAYGEGRIGDQELKVAAYAAYDAFAAAFAAFAAFAAHAAHAAHAAYAAYAASAAHAAAFAARAAALAARAADAKENYQTTADICRKYLPVPAFNDVTS